LCAAAKIILEKKPGTQFVLPLAPGLDRPFVQKMIESAPIKIVSNDAYNAIRYSRAAIVKSGTATLETALLGTPEVIVYRISSATWFLGKFLLKIRLFGLVNIILGEEVVPELFQDRMTPETVSQTALRLMDDVWMQSQIRGNYEKLRRQLGTGRVAERVAEAVAKVVSSGPRQTKE
jgi:lipid-A-disaccharide synthase